MKKAIVILTFLSLLNANNVTIFTFQRPNYLDGFENIDATSVSYGKNGDIGITNSIHGLFIGQRENNNFTYKNYNSSNSAGILNNYGFRCAFDSLNNIAYIGYGNGLSIGTKNNTSNNYNFLSNTNYNTNNTNQITSDIANWVIFDSKNNVYYCSRDGLVIGEYVSQGSYKFIRYDSSNSNFIGNNIRRLVFDNKGNILLLSI